MASCGVSHGIIPVLKRFSVSHDCVRVRSGNQAVLLPERLIAPAIRKTAVAQGN